MKNPCISRDFLVKALMRYYIIPPIPPIPPISGTAGLSSGMSVIIHSVVNIKPATEAACSSAERVTLAGSRITHF